MDNTREDFSREPVPQEKTLSGVHIALVIIGGTIGIPVYLMSAKLGSSLGLAQAGPAFLMGCLVLGGLGALTSLSGSRSHLSTYMLVAFAFGKRGAKIVNLIIALSLLGWYAVTMNVFAQAMDSMVFDLSGYSFQHAWYIVIGSLLMCAVSIAGFQGIDKLALMLVPIMLLFLLYAALLATETRPLSEMLHTQQSALSFSQAVSAVIGSYIVGVVIQPDYSRFAKNDRHAMWAVFFALGISFPIVMLLSAVPGVATGEQDLVKIMILLGIGVPAFVLLLLGSWSSNVLSLYSSSLSVATIFTRVHLWQIIVMIGFLGTVLAFLNAQAYLVDFLLLLGIAIPPVAGIYAIEVLLFRRGHCDVNSLSQEASFNIVAFSAWIGAIIFGWLSQNHAVSLVSVSAIDSLIVACVLYSTLSWSKKALAKRVFQAER
ncbi:cytosine permease [Pseudoteredinibacter isoporae]|uniref:cytosine permease n=1 Tax=Pseudoteredinibacter isoporae TaxID=570281 RepID=UPI00310A75BD